MKRTIFVLAVLIAATAFSKDVFCGTKQEILNATAKVIPVVEFGSRYQEQNLSISEADIKKGFIDITNGMVVYIKTNSINGSMLNISYNSTLFKTIVINDKNTSYHLRDGFGEIHLPFHGMRKLTKELTFRFYFSADIEPGTYKWPVSIAAIAI